MTESGPRRRLPGVRDVSLLATALIVYCCWSGTWTVGQSEQGVILRFGEAVRTVPAGIHFTFPWPVERLIRVPTTEVRTMAVGFATDVELATDDTERLTREPAVEWLTGDTNIFELKATVTYTIKNPKKYLFGCTDLTDGRSRDYVIRAATESVITELAASMLIDDVLSSGKTRLQNRALDQVQGMLDDLGLGVRLTSVNIVEVKPPASVVRAFTDVSSAKADRERSITDAEGEAMRTMPQARSKANRLTQEAEVYKTQRLAEAYGAADSFKKLSAEVAKNPDLAKRRLWMDAVQNILSRARVDVVQPPQDGDKVRVYVGQ